MIERTIPFNQLAKARYNRGISRNHVNAIKGSFREDLVQPVLVSFREGKYYIVNGQHTAQAIYELNGNDPNTPIKCHVKTGLTYEQEADLYYNVNTYTQPLSTLDLTIGRIEANDAEAIRFRDVIESCGYVIGTNTNSSINAISLAWKLFRKDDGEHLTRVLSLTHACWPNNKSGVDRRIIEGISLFLQYHGDEYKTEQFVKRLSAEDPKDLVRRANSYYAQMDSRAFTKAYCMYTIIANCYNARLHNRLDIVPAGMKV